MNYKLYGYSVSSEIELYAPTTEICAEISVFFDENYPQHVPKSYSQWIEIDDIECRIIVDGLAVFFVREGKYIYIHATPGANLETIKAYVTGACFGIILQQRGAFSIHGSCLKKNGKTLLICGTSGAGKSTISANLLKKGWKLMADDIVPIFCRDGVYFTASSFPAQKMWQDTYDRFGNHREIIGTLYRGGGRAKYQVDAMEHYVDAVLPLNYGIMLSVGSDELLLSEVTGFAKTDLLMRNRYVARSVPNNEIRGAQLQYCIGMAKQMRLFLAERPRDMHTEEQIVDFLLREIEKDNT